MTEALDYYPEIRQRCFTTTWGWVDCIVHRIYQWAPVRPPASTEFQPQEYISAEVVSRAIHWWEGDPTRQWLEAYEQDGRLYLKLHCSDRTLVYRVEETDLMQNFYLCRWPD